MADKISPKSALEIPMKENDAKAATIGEYLKKLLLTVWAEGECFSGKRPFGNSGWEWDLYKALVAAGAVDGEIDEEWGDLLDFDQAVADGLICAAIQESFK